MRESLACFSCCRNHGSIQCTYAVRHPSMPHVPFIMPSACHSTPHCQQMNAGLYILSLLSLTDAGQNEVRILHLSRDAIIASIHNVDEEGKETVFVAIIGMYGILKFPLPLSRHVPMPELSFRKSRGVDNIHSPVYKVFVFVFTDLSILEGNLLRNRGQK